MLPIHTALIACYHKAKLLPLAQLLQKHQVTIYATEGTHRYLQEYQISTHSLTTLTGFSSLLDGRVKTLHPKIFAAILADRDKQEHVKSVKEAQIPLFDFVVVDLYPFEEGWQQQKEANAMIELIDIGGVSLIRAAAKNYKHVLIVSSAEDIPSVTTLLEKQHLQTTLEQRRYYAQKAFYRTLQYDSLIAAYLSWQDGSSGLRYGENPHQKAFFTGDLQKWFHRHQGKPLSYNNLLDIDSGLRLLRDLPKGAFIIIKHTNACGVAIRENALEAYEAAFACDPQSAFGGILITDHTIDKACAQQITKRFFEVLVAPSFDEEALKIFQKYPKRIILQWKQPYKLPLVEQRSVLNGILFQEPDKGLATDYEVVTDAKPTSEQLAELKIAEAIVKHLKSNAIALVKDSQLIGAGMGQPSRIDALKQAIEKAKRYGFSTQGAVLASDAFFPFSDSVELAYKAGISAILQPGGSIRDKDSIDFCNAHQIPMIFSHIRHFKH